MYDIYDRQEEAARLAILGTATVSEMRKLLERESDCVAVPLRGTEILSARRPDWLLEWANMHLEAGCPSNVGVTNHAWLVTRRLIRAQLIPQLTSDQYIVSLIPVHTFLIIRPEPTAESRWPTDEEYAALRYEALLRLLTEDPDLLSYEVWRLFEVEAIGSICMSAYPAWERALVHLSNTGRLDRQRMLTCSLNALQRDFTAHHAGFHSRLHDALKPTLDEQEARSDTYLELLRSNAPNTVALALRAGTALDRAERLPPDRIVAAVPPALLARAKSTCTMALKLLVRAAERDVTLRRSAASAVATALESPHIEVQKRALEILEGLGQSGEPDVRAEIEDRLPGVAASLQARVRVLLGESEASGPADESERETDLESLVKRGNALPPDISRSAGVADAALGIRERRASFSALELPFLETPRLDPDRRLEPIVDLEQLMLLFSSVTEHEGPPDDVERVLDGFSRLCGAIPLSVQRETAALAQRTESPTSDMFEPDLHFDGHGVQADMSALGLAWTTGAASLGAFLRSMRATWSRSLPRFHSARVAEIAVRCARREGIPLLATPTHGGGWIEPAVAVERFRARSRRRQEPNRDLAEAATRVPTWTSYADVCDIVQALLRLAPDGRAGALARAGDLKDEPGLALRYALGADDVQVGATMPIWVAAARARSPYADDPRVEARFPGLGPGGGRAGSGQLVWKRHERDPDWGTLTYDPVVVASSRCDLPTTAHFTYVDDGISWQFRSVPQMRSLALIWPQHRYPWWMSGRLSFSRNINWATKIWADVSLFEMMMDPDEPITDEAADLLALALASKEPAQCAAAVDVLIASIEDSRLDGRLLGSGMINALVIGELPPNRWQKSLTASANAAPLHGFVIRDALEHTLASRPDRDPAKMIGLLELLNELGIQTGIAITNADARDWLGGITGSGKAARLASAILDQHSTCTPATARSIGATVLANRIARAERWQRWTCSR